MFMLPWSVIWIAVLIGAGVLEALTTELTAIWFIPSSLVALVLSFFGVAEWIQVLVFFVLAVAFLVLIRPFVKKYWSPKIEQLNVDALIGVRCIVTSRIENISGNGEVKVNGLYWAARSADEGTVYEVGDQVTVIAIEGVKLICK